MKKLLLGAALVLGSLISIKAQTTIMLQPFGTASIPGGWTQTAAAVPADNWKFTNAWGANAAGALTMQGYCACIDDWDNNPSQTTPVYDTLKGPSMNCSTYPTVYLSMNYFFFNDDAAEVAQILYSINGGATWLVAVNLPNTQTAPNYWSNAAYFDISAVVGGHASVMLAFAYFDGVGSGSNNGYVGTGMCVQDLWVYSPSSYDVQVTKQNLPFLMQVGTAYNFTGVSYNQGTTAITSMNMNYSVNHQTPVSQAIPGIGGFSTLTSYNWSMNSTSSKYTPATSGIDTIRFWASNLNGNLNTCTDTLVTTFLVVNQIVAKQPLYEEQTGQSCVFCMIAAPNMDSVYDNAHAYSNIVRYHVPIPGRDFMYDANTTPSAQKEGYYAITGAPWGDLDGSYLNPSLYQNPPENTVYSSTTLQPEAAIGSPIKIDITSSLYDAAKDSFYVAGSVTSYAAFNAGLRLQVALTLDSITYTYDLSSDDPKKEFAPPVGTNAAGYSYQGAPDYLFDYLLKFTHVCEEMFPNSGNGTVLTAFTAGQSQPFAFGWKRSHPWGSYDHAVAQRDSDFYDSSSTGQFVAFVQTNSAISAYGMAAKYVIQSASAPVTGIRVLGVPTISDAVSFKMYPNPTNNNTNLVFKLNKDQNVTVDVFNMLGEKVYSDNQGMMSAGQHTISINGSSLQNGVYFVRFNADNVPTTQKLIIQK